MLVFNLIILTLVILYYRELQAISFDETFAFVVSVPVDRLYLLLVGMVALTVVMTMRIVGLIMVIALLTIPPAIAGLFVKDMKRMMIAFVRAQHPVHVWRVDAFLHPQSHIRRYHHPHGRRFLFHQLPDQKD